MLKPAKGPVSKYFPNQAKWGEENVQQYLRETGELKRGVSGALQKGVREFKGHSKCH